MSQTKRDSIDGVGTEEKEFWHGYEVWSDSLEPMTEEDVNRMAERDGEEYYLAR